MTIPQIDEVLSELEGAITELENFKNKLYEESGQAKGGQIPLLFKRLVDRQVKALESEKKSQPLLKKL